MTIHAADRKLARSFFRVAIGLIERDEEMPTIREAAHDALRMPNPSTIRGLIAAGSGKPWLPNLIEALAQVGIAAAEDVLGGDDDE